MSNQVLMVDHGMPRLLKAVSEAALHSRRLHLEDDFCEVTPAKEFLIWDLLQDKELFPNVAAVHYLKLRFGLSGYRERTPSECAKCQTGMNHTVREINQMVDGALKTLASCLVPMYAAVKFPLGAIALEYLQLPSRAFEALQRGGILDAGRLAGMTDEELVGGAGSKGVRGFGQSCMRSVDRAMKYCQLGLELNRRETARQRE